VVIYPLLSCLAWKWLQIGTDMLLIITSTGNELLRNVNIDDLEWPWTLKILILSDFWQFLAAKEWRDEMDGDRPRLPVNKNCHGLSRISWALGQISCSIYVKQTALLNVHVLFLCLYKICILIILKISTLISRYFHNISSISYRNWNPDIESSLYIHLWQLVYIV